MKIRIIVAHPRKDSLTMRVASSFIKGAKDKGNSVELVDLYREAFNPVLSEIDEPDFESKNNVYSDTVMQEAKRIEQSDALVFIFPIWWYSMPAIMKGYVDRVINYGVAYGQGKDCIVDKIRFIGLGGVDEEFYKQQDFISAMDIQLNRGISNYIGIEDTATHLFLNTFAEGIANKDINTYYKNFLKNAYEIGNQM